MVAIRWQLLLHGVLENEGVGDDLIAGFHARDYFLRIAGEHFSSDDGDALEFISARGRIDPIAIVQVEDCRSWDRRMGFLLLSAESGGDEHAGAHVAGIVDLDTNFGGADRGIEDGTDVADGAFDDLIGIGVEADVGGVSQADVRQIVFVDVADDPYVGEI